MDYLKTAKIWAENPCFDNETQKEARKLLKKQNRDLCKDSFGSILEFGTGGLRGIMGVGTNRVNRYTIQTATEGVARIIMKKNLTALSKGVVIGYDTRSFSFEFAKVASEVLAGHGIPVFLFSEASPTPLVSFELLRRNAYAGIIITASHNPPEYNGYKVYWENGGQIVPPIDVQIINQIRNIKRLNEIPVIPFEKALDQMKIEWIHKDTDDYYLSAVNNLSLGNCENNKKLGVVFTPLHGTGGRLVPDLLSRNCFEQLKVVEKQMVPDGKFSTVSSPNPEDVAAFNMAVSQASDQDELILANDPDADRLGAMIRDSEKKWHWLTGNQIGVLILDFILSNLRNKNLLPKNGVIITTVVTSPLVAKIADEYGLKVVEVLTGFKWIAEAAQKYEKNNDFKFVFGIEESHGYLMGNHSRDKDGIWASLVFAEMTAFHKANHLTPLERLNQIYQHYGYYLDVLETRTFSGSEGISKIQHFMNLLRESPPETIGGNTVVQITDFLLNTITHTDNPSSKEVGRGLPPSNVISILLEDKTRIIARPSGTEPKIKYYFNLCGDDSLTLEKKLKDIQLDFLRY